MMFARKSKMKWKKPLHLLLVSALTTGLWSAAWAPQTVKAASDPVYPGGVSTNLHLWLRAEDGVTAAGGTVSEWKDQSGHGYDFSQADPTKQPAYNDDSNRLNFNKAITLDGTNDFLQNANGILGNNTPYDNLNAFIISKIGNNRNSIFWQQTNDRFQVHLPYDGIVYWDAGNQGGQRMPTPAGKAVQGTYYIWNFNYGINSSADPGQSIYRNGEMLASKTSQPTDPPIKGNGSPMILGREIADQNYYKGQVGEFIFYSGPLTAEDRQKINSYLAIKYGVSLNSVDYLDSSDNVIWQVDAKYNNNIAGIARDDGQGLQQKQSRSTNDLSKLTIGIGTQLSEKNEAITAELTDKQSLIWGDNGKALVFSEQIGNINKNHSERIWKVQNTGNVGEVLIAIPKSQVPADATLRVGNSETDFTNAAEYPFTETQFEGEAYFITKAPLANGQFFTFAAPAPVAESAKLEQAAAGENQITLTFDQEVALTDLSGFTVNVDGTPVVGSTFKVDPSNAKMLILTLPTGTDVTGKSVNVSYNGTGTLKGKNGVPARTFTKGTAEPTLPTMGGKVSINGTAKYGETLTADISGITYAPDTGEDVPTYQWYRDGVAIPGAASASYELTEDDIGKPITVKVTADGIHATGSVTSEETAPVAKADGPAAPSAPEEDSTTATSITLKAVAGQEYSRDGVNWQDSPTFDGLTPGTDYTFVTRIKGTAAQSPSAVSEAITIRTPNADLPLMGGVVSISGTAKYGETLTADVSGITYTPNTTENVPTYQWYRDGVAIEGATNESYTLTEDDIGKAMTVMVIADGTHAAGSVRSAATAPVSKVEGPTAPSAPVEASKTATSITLTGIAGQEYSKDGGLTWQDSPTFNGLTPDTDYTFVTRVKATATHNSSAISEAAKIRTSVSASNGNTGGNNSGSTPTPTAPVTPTTPVTPTKPVESGIKTSVNDKDGMFATGTTSTSGDRTTTSVQVDLDKLNGILAEGTEQQLAIHSPKESDLQVGGLTADTLKQLADKGASLDISNPLAIYPVPGGKMDLNGVSKQLGNAALNDIAVHVGIARSSDTLFGSAKNKATAEGYELITTPVDLNLTFTKDGKTVQSGQLNGYAKKYIALPEGIDPNRITTGVVINPDGSVFHVPTVVTKIDSRYYALINDLRSSGTYSVIWNPQDFEDVRYHWGRDDVNNIAARLDLKGNGDNTFSPNRSVTRSEFAEIVVTGLGLKRQDAPQANFYDVPTSVWYKDAVALANEFDIVRGYDDGNFKGEQQITREQGFAMIARAYRLIQSEDVPNLEQIASTLAPYGDGTDVASWAKADVAQLISAGIIQGNGPKLLSPKAQMTRAEVTALIARMLKVTNLIDK
uniref:S-layer homology domain-containing protein n=1 Tax=Paenibacillus terrae TaxID=159743 RepID=UPI001643C1CD|nr:S-layer homology domain-containing protein [Paenibacillus terrae]